MARHALPNLGLFAGYAPGEDGWGDDMNLSLATVSVLLQAGVKGRVAALPDPPVQGDVVILTGDQRIAYYDAAAWHYLVPAEGWLVYDRDTNGYVSYDGAAWADLVAAGAGGGSGGGGGNPYSPGVPLISSFTAVGPATPTVKEYSNNRGVTFKHEGTVGPKLYHRPAPSGEYRVAICFSIAAVQAGFLTPVAGWFDPVSGKYEVVQWIGNDNVFQHTRFNADFTQDTNTRGGPFSFSYDQSVTEFWIGMRVVTINGQVRTFFDWSPDGVTWVGIGSATPVDDGAINRSNICFGWQQARTDMDSSTFIRCYDENGLNREPLPV